MLVKSNFTGKVYDTKQVCRIINPTQIAAYLENDVVLLDLYSSKDYNTGKPILVGIFDRKESYESYKLWCNYQL